MTKSMRQQRLSPGHGSFALRGALVALSVSPALVAAADCISLKDSTTCPAFSSASVSKDENLIDSL